MQPMSKEATRVFLDQYFDLIKRKVDLGWKPARIAEEVNINAGRPGAVSNRQISNWIYQRKKSGWLKTHPVSQANKNLRADPSHQATGCMFVSLHCLIRA
jgi:hypothetical protein